MSLAYAKLRKQRRNTATEWLGGFAWLYCLQVAFSLGLSHLFGDLKRRVCSFEVMLHHPFGQFFRADIVPT